MSDFGEHYVLGRMLGQGSYGSIHHVTHRATGMVYAAKIAKYGGGQSRRAASEREARLMSGFQSENVMHALETFSEPDGVIVVMELMDSDLFTVRSRGRFSNEQLQQTILQMLLAVQYLHSQRVAHMDIKLENFLCRGNSLKICDFGLSRKFDVEFLNFQCAGSILFLAPEMLDKVIDHQRGIPSSEMMSFEQAARMDMWSIGVCIIVLVLAIYPFPSKIPIDLRALMRSGVPSQIIDRLPPELQCLVLQLLEEDPLNRLTVNQAIAHPYLAGHRS